MDPISFPKQIRDYFQENPIETASDDARLTKIFQENAPARNDFIAWAKAHQSIVVNTPRLYKALDLLENDSHKPERWEEMAKNITTLYFWYRDDGSSALIEKVLAQTGNTIDADIPANYASTVLELFESGVIKQDQVVKLFSTSFKKDSLPLQNSEVLETAIPFLDKIEPDFLVALLSIKNKHGRVLLVYRDTFTAAIPLLYKLDVKALVTLLSIQDDKGLLPLNYIKVFKAAFPLLNKLNPEDLIQLLSIKNLEGKTPLHYTQIFKAAFPLLDKLIPEDLIQLLSIKNLEGKTPLHYTQIFKHALTFIIIKPEKFLGLLSVKDDKGQTPLHNPDRFILALDLFDLKVENIVNLVQYVMNLVQGEDKEHIVQDDELNQLFSIQDNEGNTILHDPRLFEAARARLFFARLKPAVFQMRNADGISVEESAKSRLSDKWLVKDKATIDLEPLSEEEYQEKVGGFKEKLDKLWNSFVFGEGNIPKEYLNIRILNENKTFTPEDIKGKLDAMTDKIINKTPWLGTPPATDPQGLHLFYSQMLTNFEEVVSNLTKEDSPEKKAGPLISIAKVELEGRCAAAYQSEIEQAKILQDSDTEEAGLEANFNKLARASLNESIETIVRRDYDADSHAFSQMLFSVGMAPSADPLTPVTVDDCQEKIKNEWTKNRLVLSLTEMIGRIDSEQLHDWFRSFTPEDFGQDFRIKQTEIEQVEKEIIHDTKDHLKQKGLEDSLCDSALTIFQSTQGAALGLSSRPRKFVSDAVFDRLNQATTLDEAKEAQALFSEENKTDRLIKLEIMDKEQVLKEKSGLDEGETKLLDDLRKERNALTLKSMEITSEFNTLKLNAETRIKLGELLKVQNPALSREELDIIVTEKKIFDDKIRALADEKEIDFSPIETGLPSRGIEYQRRIAYAAQFFTEKDEILKLNKRGTTDILLHIGVLENVDLVH